MEYEQFLQTKIPAATESGFDAADAEINPALKSHQRDAVRWACKGGRRALFESFGLGKTAQELEWCRLVVRHIGGAALIILPLGVKQEFARDATELLQWPEPPTYVRTQAEARQALRDRTLRATGKDDPCKAGYDRVLVTNYERVRDGDIRPNYYTAVSLDEASVLRDFGSKTYQEFLPRFAGVPYKLVATATPSPNRYKELIHYAGFLGAMDTGQALTRFFQRDSQKAGNLTLYPHKEEEFWLWVSTWALFAGKPSDVSPAYSDQGYDLPKLTVRWHELTQEADAPVYDRDGQMLLVRDAAMSLRDGAREKRESIGARVRKAREIVEAAPGEHFLLWHDLEAERHAIKAEMPEAVEVYGTLDLEEREKRVTDFAEGRARLLSTKKSISGSGCNFQRHCHRAVFLGIDYEFNDFIQAIHRIYRFLQAREVEIDILYMDTERSIRKELERKWRDHDKLQAKMRALLKQYGLNGGEAMARMRRSIGVNRLEAEGEHYRAVLNDCILETATMPENSAGLIVTSIPFSNHYEYTPSYNDLGHNEDTERFFEQMDFLAPNLLRVLQPGRMFCCHVKDRVLFGSQTGTGMPTIEPFHALTIAHYQKHGFLYLGMITVVTDVVRENNQTYRLGWSEQCKDGSKMGVGCPEYVLLFRKRPTSATNAYADAPVQKTKDEYTRARWQLDAHGYWRSSGDRLMTKEELAAVPVGQMQKAYLKYSRDSVYSYEEHVALCEKLDAEGRLPATFMLCPPGSWVEAGTPGGEVWDDIVRMRTLNGSQKRAGLQMHVCPLQLDIVDRLITRYSSPGDVVYDPFGGLMTVPSEAVRLGRYGIGCELNPDYYRDGLGYLEAAENERRAPTLFDLMGGNAG